MTRFRPLCLNALYTGIERGLAADVLAARALGGRGLTVCTSHVVASHGTVTDVLEVPTDTVRAQVDHLLALPEDERPDALRIGVVGHAKNVPVVADLLRSFAGRPAVLDVTLSGPAGEDIASSDALEALSEHLHLALLVTMRRVDAQLAVAMEINSLDDAQVAVQRLAKLGAPRVLLRCGALPARFFEGDGAEEPFATDLYYDGAEFHLYEAPLLEGPTHGASSALLLALLRALTDERPLGEALQEAKRYVSEALRHGEGGVDFFWNAADADAR